MNDVLEIWVEKRAQLNFLFINLLCVVCVLEAQSDFSKPYPGSSFQASDSIGNVVNNRLGGEAFNT